MTKPIASRWSADAGQALIEYTLLLAFLAIAVLVLAVNFNGSVSGATSATNNQLAIASAVLN